MPGPAVFPTPDEAALANWPPSAHARVIDVEVGGNRAEVIVDTDPSEPDWVYCVRSEGGWREVVSGNGPTIGWDDPSIFEWE